MHTFDAEHAYDRVSMNYPEVIQEIATLERIQIGLESAAFQLPEDAAGFVREAAADIRAAVSALRSADDSLGRVIENVRIRNEVVGH